MIKIKEYCAWVPFPASIALSVVLGWIGSALFLYALLLLGFFGLVLFTAGSAAAMIFGHYALALLCKRVRSVQISPAHLAVRIAVPILVYVFLAGSFLWAGELWGWMNDFWF